MLHLLIISCLALATVANPSPFYHNKDGRIVGGKPIEIVDRPFQISLQLNGRHYCGGSIINKNTVVSAAHCTQKKTKILYSSCWY